MKHYKHLILIAMMLCLFAIASAKIITPAMASNNPVVDVVKATREGIVQIRVEATVNVSNNNPFMDDDFFRYFFPQQPQQTQRPVTSMGSGFVYEYNTSTREAFIMTNNHVVEKGKDGKITVTLADKVTYEGTVVGLDPNTDVAVIKITVKDSEKVTVVPLGDSSKLDIGAWAIAIGNPFGDAGLDRTVTLGVISALGRANLKFGDSSPAYQDYIQTDAAINPGNSGGPLLNINGEVIGINAAITSTSGGNIGIGFAIPINLAKKVVDDLVANGKVARAYIGILPQEISPDIMESFNLKEVAGVLVANVEKDSPAEKAGLKVGDVILEFNSEKVPNVPKFRIAVATSDIGKQLPVKIVRDNKEDIIKITLDAFPDDGSVATIDKAGKASVGSGISVDALDSQIAKRLGVTADKGVVVTSVTANSPAAKAGIAVGNVIASIEGIEVNSPADFSKVMTDVQSKMEKTNRKIIRLYVIDKSKNPQFVVLRFE